MELSRASDVYDAAPVVAMIKEIADAIGALRAL